MINKNKKYEFLVIIVIVLILFSFCGIYILNLINQQKFSAMRDNVYRIGSSVKKYATSAGDTYRVYSLLELIDLEIVPEIENPFNSKENCSTNYSKVVVDNNEVYVTLSCGHYYIDNVHYKSDDIKISSVGKWVDINTSTDLEIMLGYNYKVDGKIMFKDFVEKEIFIYLFNKKNNTNYKTIGEIESLYDVVSKNQYRTNQEVVEKQ